MSRFIDLIISDLRAIFTSVSILTIVLAGNIIYAFFYPSPYLNDILVKQHIAVVDDDNTSLSRQLIFNVMSAPKLFITDTTTMQEAKAMLERQEIFGILHIPKGFETESLKATAPNIYYIANNSYFFIYSTILEGLNNATNALHEHISMKRALRVQMVQEYGKTDSAHIANPINVKYIPLYNPSVGYLNYVLAAILIFILHQTILMASGILTSAQNRQIYEPNVTSKYFFVANPLALICARIVVFIIIYIPLFLFYFGFIYDFYHITTFAKGLELISFGVAFIVSASCFGIFLGSLFNSDEYIPQLILVMSMPLLFALGFIWPNELIPNYIKAFMWFIPITPSVNGFLELNQMGAPFSLIATHFYHLLGLSLLYITLAYIILKKRYKIWQITHYTR